MIELIRDVATQPSAAFRELPEKAGPRQAAPIVLLVCLISVVCAYRAEGSVGIYLVIGALKIAGYFLTWYLASMIVYGVSRKAFGGAGDFRATLTALGFAALPLVVETILSVIASRAGARFQIFQLFCIGWSIMLLYIATRETHDLSGLGVTAAVLPAILAAAVLSFAFGRVESFVYCFDKVPPGFLMAEVENVPWDEPPAEVEQVVRNGGFEEPADEDTPIPMLAKHWERPGRGPLSFLCEATAELDRTESREGRKSARLGLRGIPQADMVSGTRQELPPLKPGGKLHFGLWIKTRDAVAARAIVVFSGSGERGPQPAGTLRTNPIRGTTDWQEYRIQGYVPEGADHAVLFVLLQGAGVMWVDDVRVYAQRAVAKTEEPDTKAAHPSTPEEAVTAAVRKLPDDALPGNPAVFVGSVRDRTSTRADVKALRQKIETTLVAERQVRPVDRDAEAAAQLNYIDFLDGKPLDRNATLARAGRAGARFLVFGELAPAEESGVSTFRLWLTPLPSLETTEVSAEVRPAPPVSAPDVDTGETDYVE